MEISLNKAELAGALAALGKLVSRTSLIKAYQAIQIEGIGDTLFFRTCSIVEQIEFRMNVELETDIPASLVEFEQFRLAVRSCKNKTLKLGIDNGEVCIDGVRLASIGGQFPMQDRKPGQDSTVMELPADTLSALSMLAPLTDKGLDVRKILSGINISGDGFTATDGKELSNIPAQIETTGSVTIPFPLTLLATKAFGESGKLITWRKDEDTHFVLTLGSWTWRSKAIRGNYPNWKCVVPERTAATHYVSFQDDRAERLTRYLKSIPDDREHNNAVKLSRLPEVPDNLHLESSNGMLFSILAEFDDNWSDLSFTVRKELLLHLLNAGHRKIELNDAYGPIVGTGGTGQYIAMPICPRKQQAQTEQTAEQKTEQAAVQSVSESTTNTTITKESITMPDIHTIHTVSAPVQTSAQNHESELNPLDELAATIETMKNKFKSVFDELTAMSRKVREATLAQKQKDREYQQTKRTIERIRTASGF